MDEATKAEIKRLDAENDRQNHRIGILETEVKNIVQMNVTMQKMSDNLESMVKEQSRQVTLIEQQGSRLEKLEKRPSEAWNTMQKTVFTTICGAAAGAVAIALFRIIAMYI